MGTLPKPLIGLLLGTVAFFAIWMVALKPHSSSSGGSQGGVGQYQPAINKAHQAVTTSNQANAKLGAPTATAPATTPAATTPAATTQATAPTKPAAKPVAKAKATPATKPTAQSQAAAAKTAAQTVGAAIRDNKVVAILFYNDAAADDRAVKTELAAIPTHRGQVVKVAVPVSQLIQFSSLAQTVDVNTAPELVLIDRTRQASTLVGYADSVEIAQRINDALATK
ncbi:MAG TPA: hypothetical protein VJ741_15700 [Solirubrobacteraceae bacterium]|nr:hypothetical protein [Solirubrobacteraceae bacterium]